MVSNEFLESKLDELALTPTAHHLGYEDTDLHSVLSTQQGVVELTSEQPAESTETWLRTTTESFVFNVEEWR